MSTLKAEICRIEKVENHPNADRLEIVQVKDWNCVVSKNSFSEGDLCLYIPIDSILPEELEKKIFGEDSKVKLHKHRVRTIKLRGVISQGLIIEPEKIGICAKEGQDLTSYLGITKYEPPEELPSVYGTCNKIKKRYINSNFHKYTDISNIKNYPKVFEDGEGVYISEKLHGSSFRAGWVRNEANTIWKKIKKLFGLLPTHEFIFGCFDYFTQISLADGSLEYIGKIVANKLPVKVLGMDNNGKVVETKILSFFNNGVSSEWIRIKYERKGVGSGSSKGAFTCTPNHLIFYPKNNSYIEANKLKIGESLLMKRPRIYISPAQESILIGKMLGDGNLNENAISFGHKKAHEEYLEYTLDCLGPIAGNKQKEMISGYGTLMVKGRTIARQDIFELFSKWFISGKKEIPTDIQLNPISLAFWYMDDGSMSQRKEEHNVSANFATNDFSYESCQNIVNSLKLLGIESTIHLVTNINNIKRFNIRLNVENSEKLFLYISPYVPICLQYKLPEKYRKFTPILLKSGENPFYNDVKEVKILDIKKISKQKIKYDIETETNNFFAGGILVHNSRNVQLSYRNKNKYFYDNNVYAKMAEKYDLKNKLKMGEVVYGEIVGDGIQHGYGYGCRPNETDFYAYDLMMDDKWVNSTDFRINCGARGIPIVPFLFIGPYSKEIVDTFTTGASMLCPTGQPIREGCVIKPLEEKINPYVGRLCLKSINPEYLLLKNNSDFH